jgi:4-hydroxy-3-polyprenylbenzoate decarboxylase
MSQETDDNSNQHTSATNSSLPLVVAITGASGAIYGLRLLQFLMEIEQPVDLLVSKAAIRVMKEEHDLVVGDDIKGSILDFLKLPHTVPVKMHSLGDYGASVASGSYRTRGMAVVPCSLGSLGAMAHGLTENLIHRAAAVTLKEKRTLLIMVREMPFGLIQLRNMTQLSEAGAIVSCASPGFYHRPQSVGDQIDFVVGRVLDQFGFDNNLFKRWKEENRPVLQPQKKH